jgi:hypothetical protein
MVIVHRRRGSPLSVAGAWRIEGAIPGDPAMRGVHVLTASVTSLTSMVGIVAGAGPLNFK